MRDDVAEVVERDGGHVVEPHPVGVGERGAQHVLGAAEIAELREDEAQVRADVAGVAPIAGLLERGEGGLEACQAGRGVAA